MKKISIVKLVPHVVSISLAAVIFLAGAQPSYANNYTNYTVPVPTIASIPNSTPIAPSPLRTLNTSRSNSNAIDKVIENCRNGGILFGAVTAETFLILIPSSALHTHYDNGCTNFLMKLNSINLHIWAKTAVGTVMGLTFGNAAIFAQESAENLSNEGAMAVVLFSAYGINLIGRVLSSPVDAMRFKIGSMANTPMLINDFAVPLGAGGKFGYGLMDMLLSTGLTIGLVTGFGPQQATALFQSVQLAGNQIAKYGSKALVDLCSCFPRNYRWTSDFPNGVPVKLGGGSGVMMVPPATWMAMQITQRINNFGLHTTASMASLQRAAWIDSLAITVAGAAVIWDFNLADNALLDGLYYSLLDTPSYIVGIALNQLRQFLASDMPSDLNAWLAADVGDGYGPTFGSCCGNAHLTAAWEWTPLPVLLHDFVYVTGYLAYYTGFLLYHAAERMASSLPGGGHGYWH